MNKLILLPYCANEAEGLASLSRREGFIAEVVTHDNEIPSIIQKHNPEKVIGVACPRKVKIVSKYFDRINQDYEALTMDCNNDCFKTSGLKSKINEEEFINLLKRNQND